MAVTDWPTPKTVKNLQCFLSFASFYRRFIHGFSSIVNPSMTLLKRGPKRLAWNPAADKAFTKFNTVFTTAPILKHSDPSEHFTWSLQVHMGSGVGAVLSQHFGNKPKLHPVAFFSRNIQCSHTWLAKPYIPVSLFWNFDLAKISGFCILDIAQFM